MGCPSAQPAEPTPFRTVSLMQQDWPNQRPRTTNHWMGKSLDETIVDFQWNKGVPRVPAKNRNVKINPDTKKNIKNQGARSRIYILLLVPVHQELATCQAQQGSHHRCFGWLTGVAFQLKRWVGHLVPLQKCQNLRYEQWGYWDITRYYNINGITRHYYKTFNQNDYWT
jgi:hypothetical protein